MCDLDSVFRALSDRRRRRALCHLSRHRTVTLADLAELLAEEETDADLSALPAERVAEVYMSLYHHHVPLLEDAGFTRYDQERDLVSRTDDIRPLIDTARDEMVDLVTTH